MAQILIDKGFYRLGMKNDKGETIQNPEWVSDPINGRAIVVGIVGQPCDMFCVDDKKDIFKKVCQLLDAPNLESEDGE